MPLGRENHGNDVASCQEVDGRPSCPGEVTFEHLVKKSRQLCRLEGSRLPLCVKCFGTALLIVILCLQIWASLDNSRLKPSRRRLPNGNFLFPSFFLHLFTGIHSFTQLSTDPSFGLMHPGLILRITVLYSHFFFVLKVPPMCPSGIGQVGSGALPGATTLVLNSVFIFGHRAGSPTGICHFSRDPGSFHRGPSRRRHTLGALLTLD